MLTEARARLLRIVGRQTWLPRGQDRLLRAIWNPDAERSYPFVSDFFGYRWEGNLNNYLEWCVYCYGAYAMPELTFLRDAADAIRESRGSVVFVDVGANIGHHSLFMSAIADRVLAFEPAPHLAAIAERRMALNGVKNVSVTRVGLAAQDSKLEYSGGSTVNPGQGSFVAKNRGMTALLPVRRGEDVLREAGIERVDLIKIDVEGFEREVLTGLRAVVARDRPIILMELSHETRRSLGSENALRALLYPGASIVSVQGRHGRRYHCRPFSFGRSDEIAIVPLDLEHRMGISNVSGVREMPPLKSS